MRKFAIAMGLAAAMVAGQAAADETWRVTTASTTAQMDYLDDQGPRIAIWGENGGDMRWLIQDLDLQNRTVYGGAWYAHGTNSSLLIVQRCAEPYTAPDGKQTYFWGDLDMAYVNDSYFIMQTKNCDGQWNNTMIGQLN